MIELLARKRARCADLIEIRNDLGPGVLDASLVAIAERFGQAVIATLNRRDLAVVRPAPVAAFDYIP